MNMIEDFVYSIRSEVDVDSFKNSFKAIREIWSDKLNNLFSGNMAENKYFQNLLSTTGITGNGGMGDLKKVMKGDLIPTLELLVRVNQKLLEVADKLTDKSTEIANQMVTSKSTFIDEDIRQMMTSLGVGSNEAIAMSNVLEQMGLSTSDLFQMTPGQVRTYTELMQTWKEGMSEIDEATMNQFGTQAQEYQVAMAKLDLRKEMAYYKMMVNNQPAIERLYETQLAITENMIEFIEWLGESKLINVITDLVSGALKPLKWAGDIGSAINSTMEQQAAYGKILNQNTSLQINGVPSPEMVKEIQKAMYTSNAINASSLKGAYE